MRYVITHGHIFKNAGTTFDYALKKAFGKDFCDHRDDKAMRQGNAEYLKKFILDNPNLKAISSHHLCNPLPVSDEFECIPIYFLRNPLERIVSVYNFEKKQKNGSKGAEVASSVDLINYVRWRMEKTTPKTILNYQTIYLGAKRYLRADESANIEMFNNAVSFLSKKNVMVGIVEDFDKSFIQISTNLENYFPGVSFEYKKKNIQSNITAEEKYKKALNLLMPVLPELISCNAFDIALYEFVASQYSTGIRGFS